MKEFLLQSGPYIKPKEKQPNHLFIALIIMIFYRFFNEGMIPYFKGEILLLESFLPILLMLACILLSYGFYYIGEHFIKSNQYQKEECMIDGILIGLLLPIHTPIIILCLSIFITIIIGRYFYHNSLFVVPSLIGIIGALGFSVWLSLCHFETTNSVRLLFEFTELLDFNTISLTTLWIGFKGTLITKTSSLLCLILFLFLILKKAIKWRIPAYFIGSYFILLVISNLFIPNTLIGILKSLGTGNLLFLAIFVATDQRTTPVTHSGQILFACFLATMTYIGTYFFTPFLSMILAIIITNFLVPLFDYFGNYYQLKYCSEFGQ